MVGDIYLHYELSRLAKRHVCRTSKKLSMQVKVLKKNNKSFSISEKFIDKTKIFQYNKYRGEKNDL